nr:unnamed protein product [Callosobruchus analis]CAI5862106.1 unnamed protein product [Callosobruchus analis]
MVITREIREEIGKTVSNCIANMLKDDGFIQSIAQKVTECVVKTIEGRIGQLEQKIHENSAVLVDLKRDISDLKSENDYLIKKYDDLDQHDRRSNLRIFKLQEKDNENTAFEVTQLLESKLGIKISHGDIISCNRIGKRAPNKVRSILVQFSIPSLKRSIYNKKKSLKGSGIVIKEDLTDRRLKLMEAAIEKCSLRSVWSFMGDIFVLHNNKRVPIKCEDDLNKL